MNQETIDALNELPADDCIKVLQKCCGSMAWCERLAAQRPFANNAHLESAADKVFNGLAEEDWREAFGCHPKIGDMKSLRMKFAGNREWSAGEQAGAQSADEATLQALAKGNEDYEQKFGYIFIVCATGKSAAEMLALLQDRILNTPQRELPIASAEQRRITHLRLEKLEVSKSSNALRENP